uniref:Uncharacterized protein n=1 Tax=Panagrolaimus davidi TaxID=227884 RepID=A0A914PQY8_9BILA
MRTSTIGSCSLLARVGALLSPLVMMLHHSAPELVYIVILGHGTISLILSYLFLVETKGNNLDHVVVENEKNEVENDTKVDEETKFL